MAIDWAFLEKVEGNEDTTYIPKKDGKIIQNSGVTIGTGVDLGQQSKESWKAMGIPASIIKKLSPFFGKSKQAAQDTLDAEGNVTLDKTELATVEEAIKKKYLKSVKSWYNKSNTTDTDWSDLTDKQQTVSLSVFYNAGGEKDNPKFFGAVKKGEWDKAADELRNFYTDKSADLFPRRIKELQYLVGAGIDGIAEKTDGSVSETDAKLTEYKSNFNAQQYMTPDEPTPASPSFDPIGFMENLDLLMEARRNGPSSASQTPSEGNTEPKEGTVEEEESAEDFDYQQAAIDQIREALKGRTERGEKKLKRTANEAKLSEKADSGEEKSLSDMLRSSPKAMEVLREKHYNRPVKKSQRNEDPARREDDSKDPTYGIF